MDGGCQHENRVAASSKTTYGEDTRQLLRLGWRPLLEPIIAGVAIDQGSSGRSVSRRLEPTNPTLAIIRIPSNQYAERKPLVSRLSETIYRRISYLYLSLLRRFCSSLFGLSDQLSLSARLVCFALFRGSTLPICSTLGLASLHGAITQLDGSSRRLNSS